MRPVMTIVSRPQPGGAETVHVVRYGSERFSVFRSVDPLVQVQGIALRWEEIVRASDGRTFHGYGAVREGAFRNAYEFATSTGTLTGVDLGLVTDALCRIPRASPVLS